jgi:hypothetical protein
MLVSRLFIILSLKTCYCDQDQTNTFSVTASTGLGIGLLGLGLGFLFYRFWVSSANTNTNTNTSEADEDASKETKDSEPYRDDPDYLRLLGVTQRSNQRWMEAVSLKAEDVEVKREFFLLSKKITTNWVVQWYDSHPEFEKAPYLVYQTVSSQEMLEYAAYCILEPKETNVYLWDVVSHFFCSLSKLIWG